MCDTLILRHQGQTWFAKNSDREPAEPQRLLRLPAVRNDPEARLRTTYLDIPQAAQRHALVISQPSWIAASFGELETSEISRYVNTELDRWGGQFAEYRGSGRSQ